VASLKTAVVFVADLSRALPIVHNLDFIALAGYEGNGASGRQVRLLKDLNMSINGRHVLLVEDIVDTGLTLRFLLDLLARRGPRSLQLAALLHKPSRTRIPVKIDYLGFSIEDVFVVGYGLDHAQRHRNLPYVGVVK
jgi:hypoxanthine phosphoribosyltransferase